MGRAREHRLSLGLINKAMNPEILEFIKEGNRFAPFVQYVLDLMDVFAGELEYALVREIHQEMMSQGIAAAARPVRVEMLLRYLFAYENVITKEVAETLATLFTEDCEQNIPDRVSAALFFTVDIIRSNPDNPALRRVAELVVARCAAAVDWRHWMTTYKAVVALPKLRFSRQNILEFVFLRYARLMPELGEGGERVIGIDFDRMYNELYTVRRPTIFLSGREPATDATRSPARFGFNQVFGHVGAKQREMVLSVLLSGVVSHIGT
jgi:hypothetical protein